MSASRRTHCHYNTRPPETQWKFANQEEKNNEQKKNKADALDDIYLRVIGVRATLDIIHQTVTENPTADALYGMLFTLDGIAHDLCAVKEGAAV